ncbi:tryptophan-rich sensory protein TspO [Pseudomonas sp. KNUC1026]|uniref:tryptophan-rich sensory protein TspO n=1 Tax=Pseudomonas sp. KNUC1026 TaxID=2893890 RepID=UPI001F458EFC|nr:TspO/MBR family protein [Pseudomonas sp. KNUC1026]UFH49907.1 tryptophan-rich sensory protein [Pseudomonas sp. KNUC1026]
MAFFIFLIACGAAGTTGVLFKPGAWYAALKKPSFTPPDWAFPVAWSLIYLLLAGAGYRLSLMPGSQFALALWAAQIALNTLWTPVFFGAHKLFIALVVLGLLWLITAPLLVAAFGLDALAGWMLLPYLVWLSLAGALNFCLWRDNP